MTSTAEGFRAVLRARIVRAHSAPVIRCGWLLLAVAVAVLCAPTRVLIGQQAHAPVASSVADADPTPQPGDVIRLRIWREPDLSGDFRVSDDGGVVLPRLGAMRVITTPMSVLRRTIQDTLQRDLRDPSIDVTLLRRVQVLGAVNKPGLYDVDPAMTVGDALALAGGAAPDGKSDLVQLRRRTGTSVTLSGLTSIADTPIRSGDALYVPQRSWMSRNATAVFGAAVSATAILAAAIVTHY
ncbi:MAG: polysaccharide biosynthesis/export family protein [Gemmatimonadaceae bacterium]